MALTLPSDDSSAGAGKIRIGGDGERAGQKLDDAIDETHRLRQGRFGVQVARK